MKVFGLIQVQKTKQRLFSRRKYLCERVENISVPLVLVKVPYTPEQLHKMPGWVLKRIDRKTRKALKSYGAETVFSWDDAMYEEAPMPIPDERVPEALRYLLRAEQVQEDTLHIFDRVGVCRLHSLQEFCKMARYLCIYTDEAERMSALAQKVCDEYGVLPEIRPYSKLLGGRRLFVRYFAEGNTVGFGNFVIDGMEPDLDFGEYPLKRKEVYEVLDKAAVLPLGWFRGKKRLTSL